MADDNDVRRARLRFVRCETPAEHRRDAERLEEITVDRYAAEFLRFARAVQDRACTRVGGHRAEALSLRAKIEQVGERTGLARVHVLVRLPPDHHELIGMRER